MASNSRRRFSFLDFSHPQVWHKLVEYTEVTISLAQLITDFTNQWARICLGTSAQLQQLVNDFRKKTHSEVRAKCQLGGMMYDIWESLLLESEIEAQSLQKVAHVMEQLIYRKLATCINNKALQLSIYKDNRRDLDEILSKGHEFVKELQNKYAAVYNTAGVTVDADVFHNEYMLELVGVNSLYSKYKYNILPELLQGMEKSQLETIDTICQNIQMMASVLQEYHEQRQSSFASFVVTSRITNANEELETYICTIDEMNDSSTSTPVHIQFESFVSPVNSNSHVQNSVSNNNNNEQLIIYATPVIQMQLSSHCKETLNRLKDIKKEKLSLLAIVNPQTLKIPVKQHNDQQQSDKKILSQISDLMKGKHHLRLIELEESVLLAQQDLLKSRRRSMSSNADNGHDAHKRSSKNMKGLWRDAFRALKTSASSSGSGDNENLSAFVRRLSSRKKKHHHEEEDETIIDPVYETLRIAAETRKRTIAHYLQQRQQSLNQQASLNSQGSLEPDTQPASPRATRQSDINSSVRSKPPPSASASSSGR
ncbi:unnamed protein product [Rotaria socialis]|uniref:Uncharacterized protein n=1 Tax=Rotaria socialis TaxID=392032 RepID=A0A818L4H8_9BILA|nr:unnamed protein product [Rotaria socialis]